MNSQQNTLAAPARHPGPHLGAVATVFTILFLAGLYPVTIFGGQPYFPGPWESGETIATFFRSRPTAALLCSSFHFGAAVALGIFAATVVSQLRFLGARVAGTYIALFGGFATAFNMGASASILWVMARPGIAQDSTLMQALYYLQYVFGGPGFSVPLGLLMAGVSIPSGFMKLLPKWLVVFGLLLAAFGELSWLNMVFPKALFLIPLTRFPGFVWLIATGFLLPKTIVTDRSTRHAQNTTA
jgi:hypothetical protein